MDQKLIDKLNKRKEEGTLRSLSSFSGMIDFHSNDYLGFAKENFSINESGGGSTGSRLIAGTSAEAIRCEKVLADHFTCEAALVFNSGYDANLGLFSSLPQKGDVILYDEEIHASVRDGIRLSFANSYSFKHNDVFDLQQKLERFQGNIYVAIESLYSISGQLAPLEQIVEVCQLRGAWLIVDEAHAVGIYGEKGRGLAHDFREKIFARLITFSKAFGSHGAAVLGSQQLKNYLVNFARSFIYTTALPPASYDRIAAAVGSELIRERNEMLKENIAYLRRHLNEFELLSHATSPIQSIRITDRSVLNEIVAGCLKSNLAVKAIFTPTVKKENECLRISVHAFNTKDEISKLCELITSMKEK